MNQSAESKILVILPHHTSAGLGAPQHGIPIFYGSEPEIVLCAGNKQQYYWRDEESLREQIDRLVPRSSGSYSDKDLSNVTVGLASGVDKIEYQCLKNSKHTFTFDLNSNKASLGKCNCKNNNFVHRCTQYGALPKGATVRMELSKIKEGIRKELKVPPYVVMIDGSGKIPYPNIFKIVEALEDGCDVAFGDRSNSSYKGISDDRWEIEQFENHLVTSKFNKEDAPDAQAGCWGLQIDVLRKLNLIANGYELEIDLFSECIKNKDIKCSHVPIEMREKPAKTPATGYNAINNITKLLFIMDKLDYTRNEIHKKLEEKTFQTIKTAELGDYYQSMKKYFA